MAIDFTCAKRTKLAKLGPKYGLKTAKMTKIGPKMDQIWDKAGQVGTEQAKTDPILGFKRGQTAKIGPSGTPKSRQLTAEVLNFEVATTVSGEL